MADRILPKTLPKKIQKALRTLGPVPFSRKLHFRQYRDEELHGMLQDLLDAGGVRAWLAEFNVSEHHKILAGHIGDLLGKG